MQLERKIDSCKGLILKKQRRIPGKGNHRDDKSCDEPKNETLFTQVSRLGARLVDRAALWFEVKLAKG